MVQAALRERFDLHVSVRHLNRVRAALGVSRVSPERASGARGDVASLAPSAFEPAWQDGAGSLLLLAAAHEIGLLPALDAAVPRDDGSAARSKMARTGALLLTLLSLNAVGLRRTWNLRAYIGNALALLTARKGLALAPGLGHQPWLRQAACERAMHELDNDKDQVMTTLKVALTNLGMWTRDQWFPATYAHATWRRLEPFFRLPSRIV